MPVLFIHYGFVVLFLALAQTAAEQVRESRALPRDFAGARAVSAENCPMTKRALSAVAGFLGLCLSLSAQQTQSSEQLLFDGSTLNRPLLRLPSLDLADRQLFSLSTTFGLMQPAVDFLPPFSPAEPESFAFPTTPSRTNSRDNVAEIKSQDRIYTGGEMGVLYGKSSGKYGREFEQGYFIGEIGNDMFHITVGTAYERSSGRVPRWGR